MSSKVETYLTAKKGSTSAETAEVFTKMEEFYNKKLWHQLTMALTEFVQKSEKEDNGAELIDLYTNLISEVENKINPLSLTEMVAIISTRYKDYDEAIKFIKDTIPKVESNMEAKVLCNVLIAGICLHKLGDKLRTKQVLEETEKILDDVQGVTPVHSKFYLLQSELHRANASHAEYYRAALHFLGCTELSELTEAEKKTHAFYLGLAALLGKGVYNFGELLAHPVLNSIKDTDEGWVVKLLYAFNAGKISDFEKMKPQWQTQADLLAQEEQLREKIILLCLMEMTFQRAARDRQLSFNEIAAATGLPENQVEVMVMKALSLNLVKGTIDQVDQKVNITWVQPRVLDKTQLASMLDRLGDWSKDVSKMEVLLMNKAGSVLTL